MFALSSFAGKAMVAAPAAAKRTNKSVRVQAADRPMWLVGAEAPAHLDGSMPGDFGFDPLNLGADAKALRWYREAELQHARWAMAAVAGILVQEIAVPDISFYDAPTKIDLPMDVRTLAGIQFLLMHYVEIRRWMDFRNPGSVDKDPIFGATLPPHEVGYPGGIFAPVVPGDLNELKVKEIKNGRLAMLALVGFFAQYQAQGMGPLGCLGKHLSDPNAFNVFTNGSSVPFLAGL
ncbi:unnamed protein product [Pedinophyceae sp. YPF-701]|nr:unnamed protein product [Pedinophyceae sp. YPF-701]